MKCKDVIDIIESINENYNFKPYNYEIEHDSDGIRMSVDYDLIPKIDLEQRMGFIHRNSYYGLSPYGEMENLMRKYCEDDVKACMNAVFGIRNAKPEITKVIYSYPATVVFWSDGDKTVVKCDGDVFDEEKGLAMAIAKKFMGTNKSKSNYYNVFKKWAKRDMDITIAEGLIMAIKNKLRGAFPLENSDAMEDDGK